MNRPWKESIAWLALLAPLFFATYGFANWAASQRAHVPSIVFDWERHIPFLDWTIIPYWSSDLLYGLSLLICTTRRELRRHVARLLLVQSVSVAVFLAFPLRATFTKPETAGLFGSMFDALMSFDKPFNQAPSLHVSLAVILGACYSRHLTGVAKWLMRGWMVAVGLSTLTTWQHHFFDIPAGLWMGLFCLMVIPEESSRAGNRYWKVAACYAAAAIGLAWVAPAFHWWPLYPAGSFLIVSLIYATGRVDWFGKRGCRHSAGAAILLAPYFLLARFNAYLWTLRLPGAREIVPGVWLGSLNAVDRHRRPFLRSVLDLTAELPFEAREWEYHSLPMLDLAPPTQAQLEAALNSLDNTARPVFVCCALGVSRSASVVAAWLIRHGHARDVDDAIRLIEARQTTPVLSQSHRDAIAQLKPA